MTLTNTRCRVTRAVGAALLAAVALVGCATSFEHRASEPGVATASPDVRRVLAPTGALRIAVYAGSPTSLVRRAGNAAECGLSVDLGRELARRLGVPAQLVEFDRVQQVVDALREGRADMTITNATVARAALVDFTPPLVSLELGYLVLPRSAVQSIDDVDRVGIRVGVSQGSSSEASLGRRLRNATIVPAASLKVAGQMLQERRIDAFATNKGILFQLADDVPTARVLEGRWGAESLALAVPKGRDVAKPYLHQFITSIRAEGLVRRASACAGLRGTAEPDSEAH